MSPFLYGRVIATCSEWYRDFVSGPHSNRAELPRIERSGRLALPPPGTSVAAVLFV